MAGEDRPADENRVRLSFESRPEQSWVEIGQMPSQLGGHGYGADHRARRSLAEDVHSAPPAQPTKRPRRHLLKAHRIRLSLGDESHHLLDVALAPRWIRVAMKQVPGADDHAATVSRVAGRFAELIDRQLDLFEQEDADFLARVDEAERDYDRADREDAEEVFGRFQELVEFGTETLAEMRDAYAATLDPDAADDYVAEFNAAVHRRLPRFALEIDD
jgi:hypothetical protein